MALHLKSTGIDFADISSGELLDDYEEGTFTHTVTDGSSNMTLDMPTGTFIKIGKAVSIGGHARASAYNGVNSTLYLGGFPFTVGEGTQSRAGGVVSYATGQAFSAAEVMAIHTNEDTTRCMINLWNTGSGTSHQNYTWWSADGSAVYGLTYFVAP
jgi:hypothetical protein